MCQINLKFIFLSFTSDSSISKPSFTLLVSVSGKAKEYELTLSFHSFFASCSPTYLTNVIIVGWGVRHCVNTRGHKESVTQSKTSDVGNIPDNNVNIQISTSSALSSVELSVYWHALWDMRWNKMLLHSYFSGVLQIKATCYWITTQHLVMITYNSILFLHYQAI